MIDIFQDLDIDEIISCEESKEIMNSDSFFSMGYDHKICEDFAISKDIVLEDGKKVSISIVADGCSGSGKFVNVDFGARILAYAFLSEFSKPTFHRCVEKAEDDLELESCILAFSKSAYDSAKKSLIDLSLTDSRFLDTTLVFAVADERTGKVISGMFGDGTVVLKYKNGGYKICNVRFSNNTPYYIVYRENKSRGDDYARMVGDNVSQLIFNDYQISDDGTIASKLEMHRFDALFFRQDLIGDLSHICVMSDGMESFLNSENVKVDILDIYKEFVDFKTFGGRFVVRRLSTGLEDFMKKNNYHHYDDISCAAIHF